MKAPIQMSNTQIAQIWVLDIWRFVLKQTKYGVTS